MENVFHMTGENITAIQELFGTPSLDGDLSICLTIPGSDSKMQDRENGRC